MTGQLVISESKDSSRAPHVKRCDLCEGDGFEVLLTRDRKDRPWETAICRRCGLVCHMHIPDEESLCDFYENTYRVSYHGEIAPSARRVVRAWRNGQALLRLLQDHIPGGGEVFEVGAGLGCNVKAFELAGFNSSGIEPGGQFQGFARQGLHANVWRARLQDVPQQSQHDLVLLVHVLEHLRSPRESLDHIHGLLKPDGLLFVECPNLNAPFTRRSRIAHEAHIHNFTPASLRMLAGRCGFELVQHCGHDRTPNLRMIFRRTEARELVIDEGNYRRTWEAIGRYNVVTYHLRREYLFSRVGKLAGYFREMFTSRRELERILRQCEPDSNEPVKYRAA